MVPPQPRLLLRWPSRARRAVGLTAAIAALATLPVVALGPVVPVPLKQAVASAGPAAAAGHPSLVCEQSGGVLDDGRGVRTSQESPTRRLSSSSVTSAQRSVASQQIGRRWINHFAPMGKGK